MNDGLSYETEESGLHVLAELYRNSADEVFVCNLRVPVRELDYSEPGFLLLYIVRRKDAKSVFVHPNGDRVYETIAGLSKNGERFNVSITIQFRNADTTGATIRLSDQALCIQNEEER